GAASGPVFSAGHAPRARRFRIPRARGRVRWSSLSGGGGSADRQGERRLRSKRWRRPDRVVGAGVLGYKQSRTHARESTWIAIRQVAVSSCVWPPWGRVARWWRDDRWRRPRRAPDGP